jgi:hypothetical protein
MGKRYLGALQVFITAGCRGCKRALELAAWIKGVEPDLSVEVIDLSINANAGQGLVFAVSAYFHNERPVFLGNPSEGELQTWLDNLTGER